MNKIIQKWEHFEYIFSNIINLQNGQMRVGQQKSTVFRGTLELFGLIKNMIQYFSQQPYIFFISEQV